MMPRLFTSFYARRAAHLMMDAGSFATGNTSQSHLIGRQAVIFPFDFPFTDAEAAVRRHAWLASRDFAELRLDDY